MKYLLTNERMRVADRYEIEEKGTPALVLMERAGEALAGEVDGLVGRVLLLCGGGNNGGDGFVCARILKEKGREVDLVCIAKKFSAECEENRKKWLSVGGEILGKIPEREYAVAVDCLFGTGFHGELTGENRSLVEELNELQRAGCFVLSADIPSGVDGENGRVTGLAVRANATLCIGERKLAAYLLDGVDYAGEIRRADIGITLPEKGYAYLIDEELASSLLPERKRNSHKGTYGRAAIVAGSEDYTGAAYLSAAACLRSGVGYTALFVPKRLCKSFWLRAPEMLVAPSSKGGKYAFNAKMMQNLLSYSAVAYGMGMGASKSVYLGAKWLLENYTGKLLLDADGLNSLAKYAGAEVISLFQKKKCDVMITPHAKEFARLLGKGVGEVLENGVALAREFSKASGVTVLLKNAVTVVAKGDEVAVNATGNSGLAKGGSGDALAGILVGLTGQGLDSFSAGRLGAYLLGSAAEIAARDKGERSLVASDCIAALTQVILRVAENPNENGGEE